jgi:predicted nucleotidyltransferase
VDLLVQFDEVPGFVGYVRLRNRLEQILGRRVDLVMASGLHPRLRERVLREARHVA